MKQNTLGFTLIEVLTAIAIIGIAMTAIIKATSQNIKDTHYLQQKTIANWVGTYIINQARANLIKLPVAPDELSNELVVLGQKWIWKASLQTTPNPKIKEIVVNVFSENNEDFSLRSLTSYMYNQT